MSDFFAKKNIECLLGTLKQESWGIQVQQTTQQVFSSSAPEDDTYSVRRKISSLLTILFTWTTGEDDEEHKMSLRDEELMADLTMEELKQAFRWTSSELEVTKWTHNCTERNFDTEVRAQVDIALPKRGLR